MAALMLMLMLMASLFVCSAMSEIKKRRDLKTIMIIGAGPIVIGQVGHSPSGH